MAIEMQQDNDLVLDLTNFDISQTNGFLPSNPPAQRFSDTYYQPWDDVTTNLSQLLQKHMLRQAVHELPVLNTARLENMSEWRRAFVIFGFLAHAYVWEEAPPANRIPASLAVPFLEVCEKLRIRPVASYACLCLWNYTPVNNRLPLYNPDNLASLVLFTGSHQETWFYMMSTAIEAQGGRMVWPLVTALQKPTLETVLHCLQSLKTTLDGMADTIGRMGEHLEPTFFWQTIRPWISGFKNVASEGSPKGVIYEDGSGREQYKEYIGGSNGQTSLLPFFDMALGIEHRGDSRSLLDEMFEYMPGAHVDFLKAVKRFPSLKEFVRGRPSDQNLQQAYVETLASLQSLRQKHIAIVTRYIVMPARKDAASGQSAQGTAGTAAPLVFLKEMRSDVTRSMSEVREPVNTMYDVHSRV